MGGRLVERGSVFGLTLALLLSGCTSTAGPAPVVTPSPTAQPAAAVLPVTYDEFHASFCSARAALYTTIGNPDTDSGSELTDAMDAAIMTGDTASVDRLAAEITEKLEAGRREVAAAARWAPAAPMMAEIDRVYVGYEARIEAKRTAASRGEGAMADKFGQEALEGSGAIDAWFALIRPGVLDATRQAIESARRAEDPAAPADPAPCPAPASPMPPATPAAVASPMPPATPAAVASPMLPADLGAAVAQRVSAFRDAALAATTAVPRQVPEARKTGEGIDAYGKRAMAAAAAAANPIRELVRLEQQWLASQDGAACPLAGRYGAVLDAYWIVAQGVWTAHYAPDEALLPQALSNLDGLNQAVGEAVPGLLAAASPCQTRLAAALGPPFTTVIGSQSGDLLRDPARLQESPLGNLVADAMRFRHTDAAAAFLNSGGVRTDLLAIPPRVGEQRGEITWGEMLLVLPFGNRVVQVTVTGDQLRSALVNGFAPACDPGFSGGTGRFPQLSGLEVKFHCDGPTPVVDGLWKAAVPTASSLTPIGPTDTIRLVTLDYLLAGGDGYAMFAAGANASEPGDALLDVVIAYVEANAPVGAPVNGRIVGP